MQRPAAAAEGETRSGESGREMWASEDARRKASKKSTIKRMRRWSVADDRVCRRPTSQPAIHDNRSYEGSWF